MNSSIDTERAVRDLRDVVACSTMWSALAQADIRSKYRLSTFGSLWITMTTGAMVLAIGLFYGQFFGQDMHSYLPYFTASYITWSFIASVFGEASTTLIGSGNLIKSSQMPIVFHIMRMMQRNLIIALHNAIVLAAIWPFVRWTLYPSALLSLVIWYPEQIHTGKKILALNPVSYMLVVVRDPVLGRPVEIQTWIIAILLAAASVLAGSLMYVRFRRRIAFWV